MFGKFLENHLGESACWKLIDRLNINRLCCWCFSRNFPKIFRTAILKENRSINPYLETFHISLKDTSGWVLLMKQHSKKVLAKVNPPLSLPWKQNGNTVVAAVMIAVADNWRIVLQINIFEKAGLWTLITYKFQFNSNFKLN